MKEILKLGTRGSILALAQSNWVKERLEALHQGLKVELVTIKTTGDKIQDVPLAKVGGKGLFVKEIEETLMDFRIDLAVHSMKDVPAELPEPLNISAIPEREDPRDVFIAKAGGKIERLKPGAKVGTSSLRRSAQLLSLRPDLKVVSLRGNLDTRLRKLYSEDLDAIVVAAAGLNRLKKTGEFLFLSTDLFLPAVGQGALAVETRRDDEKVLGLVAPLDDPKTRTEVTAERAFLKRLEGGCQVPLAGHAQFVDGRLSLTGLVSDLRGKRVFKESLNGPGDRAEELGVRLAETLLHKGADRILKEIYGGL